MSFKENELDYSQTRLSREFNNFFINRKPPNDPAINGFNYLFFTSPDLPLSQAAFANKNIKYNVPEALAVNGRYLKLPSEGDSIYSTAMVHTLSGEGNVWMPFFTNRAASAPGAAQELATIDYAETWNKYKIVLGTTTKDTRIGGTFGLELYEDQNLTTSKMLNLWIDCIEGEYLGDVISSYALASDFGAIQNMYIDNMCSVYHFAVRPDGKTLIYWAKYTGVFPLTKPYDVFQSKDGEPNIIPTVQANFQFSYKEDMEIAILREFNSLMGNANSIVSDRGMGTSENFFENSVKIGNIGPSGIGISKAKNGANNIPVYELHLVENNDPLYKGFSHTNYTGN